jgi:hypothetical protein
VFSGFPKVGDRVLEMFDNLFDSLWVNLKTLAAENITVPRDCVRLRNSLRPYLASGGSLNGMSHFLSRRGYTGESENYLKRTLIIGDLK